ncbi:MAG: hypothetical protein GX587_07730, partial [Bacteroidales bacterium]|nr:hypothetical protein [Bacteroidales bacterium]
MELLSSAMDAYSNLELDSAKNMLEKALAMKADVDDSTLAKIHVGLGVLWVGGYSDASESKNHFITALCLDDQVRVDPLFSTPEIDLSFTEAKASVSPSSCSELGIGEPILEACGPFDPIFEQKAQNEVPFYIEVSPAFRNQLSRVAVKFAFENRGQFRELNLKTTGVGFNGMLECDTGEIRTINPSSIQYYIEGYDASNRLICGNGSKESPLEILMDANYPLVSRPGLDPKECVECAPWDEACRARQKKSAGIKSAAGETCSMDSDCQEGLVCNSEMFTCEDKSAGKPKKKGDKSGKGPDKFYVTLTGGSGFGYMSKDIELTFYDENKKTIRSSANSEYLVETNGVVKTNELKAKGTGWSGIPIRLSLGYLINSKISLEVSGRVDAFIAANSEPVSCWDAAKGDLDSLTAEANENYCSTNLFSARNDLNLTDEEIKYLAENSAALDSDDGEMFKVRKTKNNQMAWLVNARVRYKFLSKGGLQSSLFGGIGYSKFKYKVLDTATNTKYYVLAGMVNVELGLGLAYYFTKNVGVILDIPIDFAVGKGFAFNL